MRTKTLSFDRMQAWIGQEDRPRESTNALDLQAAAAVLRTAMEWELTGRQRECVRLYFYENRTMEEIGSMLGISRSTVCRHLQKAKARLGKAVSYCGTARLACRRED